MKDSREVLRLTGRRLQIKEAIRACTHCPLSGRLPPAQTPVPFSGPLRPQFIVLGEAPGVTEQRRGEPFVGPAGRLLRRMLRDAGLDPAKVLWCNVVSCNPYGTPKQAHRDACRRHFDAQLTVAGPVPLLAAGLTALTALAPDVGTLGGLAGSCLVIDGRPVMPAHHPAAVLRDPTYRPLLEKALARFQALTIGFTPDFFMPPICCMCPKEADEHDHRQMPYCKKHKVEIRRAPKREARRRTAVNKAAQIGMEL